MKLERFALAFLIFAVAAGGARAQTPSPRPSLTVADFAADRTGWMPPPHLGETMAELLMDRLVSGAAFRTVDREWLRSTGPAESHRVPFAALLDRARSAGVDYLVAGSVTRLSIERRSSTGLGALPPFGGGVLHRKQAELVIGLTLRVIDVRTGEVVVSSTAESGAAHQSTAGGGILVIGHVPLVGGKGSSDTGFQDRLLDEAVQDVVSAAAQKIIDAAPRLSGMPK